MRNVIKSVVVAVAVMVLAGQSAVPARAAAAPYCGITWGSAAKTRGDLRAPALVRVSTVRSTCFDRTTFEFAGLVDGYSVQYGTQVLTDGAGWNLVPYTAGDAFLAVSLRAPTRTMRDGAHPVNVLPYRTLRDVVFGGSFEGYTLFSVGVRARLPFRVTTQAGPGTHHRVHLDVAHAW